MAIEPKIYFQRIIVSSVDGSESLGIQYDVLAEWPNIKYKAATGLQDYGEQKNYVEEFPEKSKASVVVSDARKQTDITLTLYFFPTQDTGNEATDYASADETYHAFMEIISGARLIYSDNMRNRKAVVYLNGKPEIKNDTLYGLIFKEVTFKFKNVYGHTFSKDEEIELNSDKL